jgi:hypothetical protein
MASTQTISDSQAEPESQENQMRFKRTGRSVRLAEGVAEEAVIATLAHCHGVSGWRTGIYDAGKIARFGFFLPLATVS